MKPFWFAFNVTDWLSSKSVRMMSLAERGAYIGLLATAWGEEVPGTLPVADDTVRRLAEMSPAEWAVSGPALLAAFPVSECGTYRYNPRLREEHAKQQAISEKNAEKGRLSAEKRAAAKGQPTANRTATAVAKNPTAVEKTATEIQLVTTTITLPSDDGSAGEPSSSPTHLTAEVVKPEALAGRPDPARAAALATTDPADEQHWSVGPLTKPGPFRVICERLGHLGIDFEYYRRAALIAAEDANVSRTIQQWTSWIRKFFENQLRGGGGPLLKPTDGDAARTGVHAPQSPDAYRHEVRADLQAQREAEKRQREADKIAANFARTAAGQLQQPLPC